MNVKDNQLFQSISAGAVRGVMQETTTGEGRVSKRAKRTEGNCKGVVGGCGEMEGATGEGAMMDQPAAGGRLL